MTMRRTGQLFACALDLNKLQRDFKGVYLVKREAVHRYLYNSANIFLLALSLSGPSVLPQVLNAQGACKERCIHGGPQPALQHGKEDHLVQPGRK